MTSSDAAATFRRLHHDGPALFLPNAWDHASAATLVRSGFGVLGTTSLGVAAAAGLSDGIAATRRETLALARGLARLPVLVSVDLEGGFSDDPAEVADLGVALAEAGVVGINLEDGRPDETLRPVDQQAELIVEIKKRAPDLFVNARTDACWFADDSPPVLAEALRRAEHYVRAGADGIFVPGVDTESAVTMLVRAVPAPLNVLLTPQRTYRELADLGVARVSCGSLLFRTALGCVSDTAWSLVNGDFVPSDVPSYAATASLVDLLDAEPPGIEQRSGLG